MTDVDAERHDREDPGRRRRDARGDGPGRRGKRGRQGKQSSFLRELVSVVVVAVALSWLLKTFLVQAFFIPSESMEPTLQLGDRFLVEKFTPGVRDVHRGDIVVFQDPGGWLPDRFEEDTSSSLGGRVRDGLEFVGLAPSDTDEDLVKRVVGIGGDRVACCDPQGRVTDNGTTLDETYVYPGDPPSDVPFDVTVPDGQLWVMGDHRSASEDSRAHQGDAHDGMVPLDDVVGRALVLVWPLDRVTRLPIPETFRAPALDGAAG